MPLILAAVLYWVRLLRRPKDARLKRRHAGGSVVVILGGALVVLWERARPAHLPTSYAWGELAGVDAVYAMSWSLILATRGRWLERWFRGLDRMYLWHKRLAIVGTLLLPPHIAITGNIAGHPQNALGHALGVASMLGLAALVLISLPRVGRILRLSYYRWQFMHRLIGLFVALGEVHGLLLDFILARSTPLKVTYLLIGGTGPAYHRNLLRHACRKSPSPDRACACKLRARLARIRCGTGNLLVRAPRAAHRNATAGAGFNDAAPITAPADFATIVRG